MRLSDFISLFEKCEKEEQVRAIYECIGKCVDLTEEEWPALSSAVNINLDRVNS